MYVPLPPETGLMFEVTYRLFYQVVYQQNSRAHKMLESFVIYIGSFIESCLFAVLRLGCI
jgi:hypothetical protein